MPESNQFKLVQTGLNFWDKSLRPAPHSGFTQSCELLVGQVPATSPFVETLQGTSRKNLSVPTLKVKKSHLQIFMSLGFDILKASIKEQ